MEGLGTETIEDRLLHDLIMEIGFSIDEIKEIETKLEELKMQNNNNNNNNNKIKINVIKESII